jgi:predicted RNA-binding protein associated with RNAse of E/G family
MSQPIIVIKRNQAGEEVWRYTGTIIRRKSNIVVLEARFRPPDLPFMGIILREGDRFVEIYYTDRWYNIFEIHDRDNDQLKGWYCNIAQPAVLEAEDRLSYVDLALDLWVSPDGTQTVLDEDEFAALNLDTQTRSQARAAMEELQMQFKINKKPDL